MAPSWEDSRDYLRLLARILWRPGLQQRLDLSDVVQETFLEAHKNREQYRGNTEQEWHGWLRTILRRVLWKAAHGNPPGEVSLNESSQRLEDFLAADQSSPSERLRREEERELHEAKLKQLADALGKLREDERNAVELKKLHGYSVEKISLELKRTESAVGGLLRRGMHRLRQLLQESGKEEKG